MCCLPAVNEVNVRIQYTDHRRNCRVPTTKENMMSVGMPTTEAQTKLSSCFFNYGVKKEQTPWSRCATGECIEISDLDGEVVSMVFITYFRSRSRQAL